MNQINFFKEDTDFELVNSNLIESWILKTISKENFQLGDLNIIFCSDAFLLELNQQYLNHDTFTDIITFNSVEGKIISGDIFISIDRVIENSKSLSTGFDKEISRVIIHGVLHLIGYNDKSEQEAREIRAKEDFYLALQSN